MTKTSEFFQGVREALPVHVLYQIFGIPFGVLTAQMQVPLWAALGLSWIGYAGAAQFVVLQLLGLHAGLAAIFSATALINLRHIFYGMALSVRMPAVGMPSMLYLAHSLTDEAFGVNMARPTDANGRVSAASLWGTNLSCHVAWTVATAIGALIGAELPAVAVCGALMPIFFAALLSLRIRVRRDVAIVGIAVLCTLLAVRWIPGRSAFLCGALVAPTLALWIPRGRHV